MKLRNELWSRKYIPKKWMLNYVKKSEAIYILNNFSSQSDIPKSYIETIRSRCSIHRKKVYKAKKDRIKNFGTNLTKEERYRKIINSADKLVFVEVEQNDSAFTSYFGSTKGMTAFIFRDSNNELYRFTRTEVEKLVSLGLYLPRGVLSTSRTKVSKPAKSTKTLKDIFAE